MNGRSSGNNRHYGNGADGSSNAAGTGEDSSACLQHGGDKFSRRTVPVRQREEIAVYALWCPEVCDLGNFDDVGPGARGAGCRPCPIQKKKVARHRYAPARYSGHRPIPKEGDAVRAYLVNKGYNGAGYTTDGGYDVYYKNGFEILAPPTR